MVQLLSRPEYEKVIAENRDRRMNWWRQARFGMFIHYGLYSELGRGEWVMARENYPLKEYELLADSFSPKPGAPKEWARLAKEAGMKYMVLTTRHHEGFSLWDSKVNPYNSVNYGPNRDIVEEFVEACQEYQLGVGFYSSLMDWHHPDSWRCAFDSAARKRFNDYIYGLNKELLSQYGKIDILWYDVAAPMESWEGWNSLEMNQRLRQLQPDIIINNRSLLAEDFGTPEGRIAAMDQDWEACMTFNGISWGYVDSDQARPYSYNAQRIIKMLNQVTAGGGNLLLNIGPKPDGSVPEEVIEPLKTVGLWLEKNGEAVYGNKQRNGLRPNNICGASLDGHKVYLWNWIWPEVGEMVLGGFLTPLKSAALLDNNAPLDFEQCDQRITLKNLPKNPIDKVTGISIIVLEFQDFPEFRRASCYPQLNKGQVFSSANKN